MSSVCLLSLLPLVFFLQIYQTVFAYCGITVYVVRQVYGDEA